MLIKFFSIFLDIIAIGMYFKLGRDRKLNLLFIFYFNIQYFLGYYGANYSSYFVLSAL